MFNGDTAAGSLFLVGKGADPDMAHQHLDGGSFMIESEGVRWTDETGAEKYNLPGFGIILQADYGGLIFETPIRHITQ